MDGDAFDRLSMEVHRLRERVTRRGALGALLGGAAAVALGAGADDADARRRRRRKKKCRNFGGRCDHSGDCCGNSRCRNGFCFPRGNGGGGGGGGRCNGDRCPDGWECCRQWAGGIDVCVPRNHPSCFTNGDCPFGWDHCGWNGPIRECCGLNSYCCHDAFGGPMCLPDGADCDDFSREARTTDVSGTKPIPVTEIDPAEFE